MQWGATANSWGSNGASGKGFWPSAGAPNLMKVVVEELFSSVYC